MCERSKFIKRLSSKSAKPDQGHGAAADKRAAQPLYQWLVLTAVHQRMAKIFWVAVFCAFVLVWCCQKLQGRGGLVHLRPHA